MTHRVIGIALGVGLVCGTASPTEAQLWFFPDYALPSANGTPTTWIATSYGRGLNVGEVDAISAVLGKATESVTFAGGLGLTLGDVDELTIGGGLGVDVTQTESMTLSIQGGLGWISLDNPFGESITMLRLPVGAAFKWGVETTEAMITPWVMPRLNIVRVSGSGLSDTQTDLGASGGASFNFPNGFGVDAALDVVIGDGEDPWTFGIGGHYIIGR